MHKIVVFTNPHSGTNLRDKYRIRKIKKMVTNGEVHATQNLDELEEIASSIPEKKPDIIAIDGGDGTIATVLGAVHKYWPKDKSFPSIALLSGGTFNALARYAGIEKGLPYLKSIIKSNPDQLFFQDIDLMEIEDDQGMKMYGFSFALGFPVKALKEYYKKKRWKYIRIGMMILRFLSSSTFKGKYFRSFNQRIKLDAADQEGSWLTIFCQSIPSFGTYRCNMFYRADLTRKQFHVLGTKAPLDELMSSIIPIYLGVNIPIMDLDIQKDTLHLKGAETFEYQVNGELEYWGKPCLAQEIRIRHGMTIRVIRPIPKGVLGKPSNHS